MGRPNGSRNRKQYFSLAEEQRIVDLWVNQRFSITEIQRQLGRGSNTTIHRVLQRHRATRDQATSKCPECLIIKDLSEFPRRRHGCCKTCIKGKRLAKDFGLTWQEFQQILDAQGGVCAICRQPPPPEGTLCVDHCHQTGAIRGLLCTSCNVGLGFFRDQINTLQHAIAYLQLPPYKH